MDGQPVTPVRANLALYGLALGPGPHRVELRYIPSSLYVGSAVSAVTAVLWLCFSLIARRKSAHAAARFDRSHLQTPQAAPEPTGA